GEVERGPRAGLPRWMVDPAICAKMDLGPPRVALDALLRLASVLGEMSAHRRTGSSCGCPASQESARAPTSPTTASAAAPEPRSRSKPAAEGAAADSSPQDT